MFLTKVQDKIQANNLRSNVQALIPLFHGVRELGASLSKCGMRASGKERILEYLQLHPNTVIAGEELMVISGIGEWARRVRELRVQEGWAIASGLTIREMIDEGDIDVGQNTVGVDDYILLSTVQDADAATRWRLANRSRRMTGNVKFKLLSYFRLNVGKAVTGEELRYVAKDKTEWARRVRELRTEEGWPIVTRNTGRPELPIGVYVLEEDRQLPPHDRHIPDSVRVEVLERDNHQCQSCGWKYTYWTKGDPRSHLELHHVKQHAHGGQNIASNLVTLCNVCHDMRHGAS